jgi:hypothetical protein
LDQFERGPVAAKRDTALAVSVQILLGMCPSCRTARSRKRALYVMPLTLMVPPRRSKQVAVQ